MQWMSTEIADTDSQLLVDNPNGALVPGAYAHVKLPTPAWDDCRCRRICCSPFDRPSPREGRWPSSMIMTMMNIGKVRMSVFDWFVHVTVRMGFLSEPIGVVWMSVMCIMDMRMLVFH